MRNKLSLKKIVLFFTLNVAIVIVCLNFGFSIRATVFFLIVLLGINLLVLSFYRSIACLFLMRDVKDILRNVKLEEIPSQAFYVRGVVYFRGKPFFSKITLDRNGLYLYKMFCFSYFLPWEDLVVVKSHVSLYSKIYLKEYPNVRFDIPVSIKEVEGYL